MRAILRAAILLIMAISTAFAARPTIMVRPDCEVSGATCVLGDLAAVQPASDSAAQKLRSIGICPTPLPGGMRTISREQIVIALRRAGIADGSVDLLCPPQVTLRRTQSVVTGQALFDTAKSFARNSVSLPGKLEIEARRLPPDQSVPTGKIELRIKAGTRNPRRGQNSVSVEIVIDGKVYRTVGVQLNLRVFAPVLIATKSVGRSEAISQANAAMEERDITMLPDDVLFESPSGDWTASAPIAEKAVIRRQWIVAPPAVKSGESVLVVVESGGVRVTEKGTAVQDGRPGDTIKVRFKGDIREVRGVVAEPGIVKISIGRRSFK